MADRSNLPARVARAELDRIPAEFQPAYIDHGGGDFELSPGVAEVIDNGLAELARIAAEGEANLARLRAEIEVHRAAHREERIARALSEAMVALGVPEGGLAKAAIALFRASNTVELITAANDSSELVVATPYGALLTCH